VRAALALAGPGPAAVAAAVGAGRMRGVGAGPLGAVGELLAAGFAADRPIVVRDLQAREGGAPGPLEREGLRAVLLVPLRTRGRVLGLLALADGEPREFSTEEVEMALTLATAAAVALDARAELHALRTTVREQGPRLTRQAEVEQARVLSVLGAGLTRELSGVFAVLLGRSQLLLARAQDESLREGLSVLEEAAWRGTDVVQRLLGLAEADRAPAAPCDLGAIAQEALAFARPRIGSSASRIDMVAELPPTAPVIGSAIALREVVAALVLNAMEAMSGGGTVTVRARDVEGGVELVVADAGEGIGTEAAARVFDPFFTTRPGHLGLGLTVARAVILRAGGRLDLRSGAPGTTVTIWLPAAVGGGIVAAEAPAPTGVRPAPPTPGRPADEPREPLARPEPPARPDSTEPVAATNGVPAAATNGARSAMAAPGPTPAPESPPAPAPAAPLRRVGSVLIVEEEDGIRDAVSEALAAVGHHIESAVDADAALDRLARGGVDVVVTDLALRDRSGLQLAAAVKERCPRAAVVLLTGWGRRLHEARVRGAGVDVMVVKPVQPDRVRAAVAEALRLHPPA
jgi:signal transduction histidine kinase/CheY-like chemotaxis protein